MKKTALALTTILTTVNVSMAAEKEPTCRDDWHICKDNRELVNSYMPFLNPANKGNLTVVGMSNACKEKAEAMAKYGTPKWPWFAFSSFYDGDNYIKTGRVSLVEPDAQFSNAFGAMAHVRVMCIYDLKDSKVMDINVIPK
jgi:hypothetical protein